ncbi:RagB/SusD family nutrient uptake outer membrane protein [Parabacteroides pacaensis]|uniref:RagB/SusD family nutrient uptake outer membrane protein n=1 Tax=Parabacteroides pacaensis TaxID=2086575 RepID=UPI000D0F4870|nr:RagB/SusD family nutrient uptake outer membrane protein [Parabacteroides pacaensis]
MKKIIIYLVGIVNVLFSFSSCSDFLDKEPDDMLTQEMVFNDKRRTEEWLARCYNRIPELMGSDEMNIYQNLCDDSFTSIELAQWINPFPISARQGNWNPLSDMRINIWNDTYKAVRSAYIFIQEAKALPEQGLTEEKVNSMKMEARFLIAYYYTRMLAFYGPFPLITELIPSDTPTETLMKSRTPYDEIVEYLDKELTELSKFFPSKLTEEKTQFGRPTKGMCLAVRARMLLYAASPLFNGNPDYTDVVNKDGTPLFSSSYDIQKWKRAADACREVLDVAESGIYSLYIKRHTDGHIDPFLSFQDLFLTSAETNKEIIFARPNADYSNYSRARFPRGAGGNGFIAATQNLVDQFFMKNGLPITDPNSGYVEKGFTSQPIYYEHTSYDLANEQRIPGMVVNTGICNMYANREPRFYISIRYNNQYIPSANRNTQYKNGGMDGRPSHDSPQCGTQPLKAISPEDKPLEGTFSYRPGILMRLAEFYLSYAEALNECTPENPDILKYINLVRERAGILGLPQSLLGKQKEMREAIRQERRVEFAFEGEIRYNDIRRWKIAERVMGEEPTMGTNPWGTTDEEFYQRTEIMKNVFHKKMYLWPIHQNYLDNNPNLVQNKFW